MGAVGIRDAMRRGDIPGVRLDDLGLITAYASTVEDIASWHDLSLDKEQLLNGRRMLRVRGEYKFIGSREIPWMQVVIQSEFNIDEFQQENPQMIKQE